MSSKQPLPKVKPLAKSAPRGSNRRVNADPAAPPTVLNVLPDVAGDDQHNVFPRASQIEGAKITIEPWFPLPDPGDHDTIMLYANNRLIGFHIQDGDDPPPTAPVEITLAPVAELRTHGIKDITYTILHPSGNMAYSEVTQIFVDTDDPNHNNLPPAIVLPTDLTGPVTPAYLAGKPGLVCTIPRLEDSRPGDTWRAFFGDADEAGIDGAFPDTGDAPVTFPSAGILDRGQGDFALWYIVGDRSGNFTQRSFPRTVTVQVSNPPVPGTLSVVEEPLITKEEARNGVTVELSTITDYLPSDIVRLFWHGTQVAERPVGLFPIFPFMFSVFYDPIAAPGVVYTANLELTITRAAAAVTTTVDVDLDEPGDNNTGPGPVDNALDPPVVRGGVEMLENQLVENDRNTAATASFTIPPNLAANNTIQIFYGTMGGTAGSTYTVIGNEPANFVVVLNIPWLTIELYGNGDIPVYYKISNAVNYKHSPSQDVAVSLYSLTGLADAQFPVKSPQGTLNCDVKLIPSPWDNVPIFIKDPATLQENDLVTIHAARYAFSDKDTPIGDPIESPPQLVLHNEVVNGFTLPMDFGVWFRAHTASGGRGWLGITWSIYRPGTGDRGTSDEVQILWDFRVAAPPLNTCVPGATRAGTL